ncbi:MAG: mechanosensitive ion channel family protein [Candidatus Omnitrophica bacterium]|nr:mechanosensitive ion channel family protein [Candidatus Omnitrophota bacterium]
MVFPFLKSLSPWLSIPLVFWVWVLILSIVKKIVFSMAKKFAEKTKTKLDDVLFSALDLPVQLLIYASGAFVIQGLVPRADSHLFKFFFDGFKIIAIIATVLFVDKFLNGLIKLYAEKVEILKASGGFVHGVVRALIMGIGGLIILDSIGVSITPIIASLGIGSLAVALALQPTLENFFSGIQLVADKPIQVGQFIKLESGEEGFVHKIGWRSTWITMVNNNTVVMPNKMIVNSRVTNYSYPNSEVVIPFAISVSYAADLDQVERVTLDVAREILKVVPGGLKHFEPVFRYGVLGEFSINCTVALRVGDINAVALIKHEFIKRLQKRYAQEKIEIPFPTRTIVQAS